MLPQPERDRGLVDRAMRLIGNVDAKDWQLGAAGKSQCADRHAGFLARDGQRVHGTDRGGVVNHATEFVRQPEPLPQPIEDDRFELGGDRRRAPGHRVDVQRSRDHLGENAGPRRGATEVAHELRMRPMRDTRNNQAINVGENLFKRLGGFRRRRWQRGNDCTGFCRRRNALLRDVFAIIRHPIRQLVQMFAVNIRGNIAKGVFHSLGRRAAACAAIRPPPIQSRPMPLDKILSPNGYPPSARCQ